MLSKQQEEANKQLICISMEDLVPRDHLVRKIAAVMDFSFIYEIVQDCYSATTGRPSIDPVVLVKMVMLQYLYGIRSMRQTVKEIEVNNAYRRFLGLSLTDPVPHFTTFGKNYTRRFEGTTLFEDIFARILEQCYEHGFIKDDTVFADAKEKHGMRYTHYRGKAKLKFEVGMTFACMNLKKMANWVASSLFFLVFRDLFAWVFPDYSPKAVQAIA